MLLIYLANSCQVGGIASLLSHKYWAGQALSSNVWTTSGGKSTPSSFAMIGAWVVNTALERRDDDGCGVGGGGGDGGCCGWCSGSCCEGEAVAVVVDEAVEEQ